MAASRTAPVIAISTAVIVAVVAVVVALIPFNRSGAAEPSAAFSAQRDLDEVAFTLAASPALSYTGSLTVTPEGGETVTVDFRDLRVTSSISATGLVTVNGVDGQYRQIGNLRFASGPTDFWEAVIPEDRREYLDLDGVGDGWALAWSTTLPSLGLVLAPKVIAGRIGNVEQTQTPELGVALPAPNNGLPDERYQPTSDPQIDAPEPGRVIAGDWETTYTPEDKSISHIKGNFTEGDFAYSLDTDVSTVDEGQIGPLFSSIASVVPDLSELPAPGIPLAGNPVSSRSLGCTTDSCTFEITVSGRLASGAETAGLEGFVNYGVTAEYARDDGPLGAIGGTCEEVSRTDYGDTARVTCVARNLPAGEYRVRMSADYEYLPYATLDEENLETRLDQAEELTKDPIVMVRTGVKKPEAAQYGWEQNFIPSSYAVVKNDYLFDGISPVGNLVITLAPGYAEHVTNGRFDPSWPGTETLKQQIREQAEAAPDGPDNEVVWWVAENSVVPAVEALITDEGLDDRFVILQRSPL